MVFALRLKYQTLKAVVKNSIDGDNARTCERLHKEFMVSRWEVILKPNSREVVFDIPTTSGNEILVPTINRNSAAENIVILLI